MLDQVDDQPSLEKIDYTYCGSLPKDKPKRLLSNGQLESLASASVDAPVIHQTTTNGTTGSAAFNDNNNLKAESSADFLPAFPLLPGETTRYFSTFQTTQIVLTNFRWFVLLGNGSQGFYNVPLRCIDAVETRELFFLIISCRDGRTLRIAFNNSESCCGWYKHLAECVVPLLNSEFFAFTFHRLCQKNSDYERMIGLDNGTKAVASGSLSEDESALLNYTRAEFQRLGFSGDLWRITQKNKDYKFCSTYPQFWITPAAVSDEQLDEASRFRTLQRLPVVTWRHRGTGAVLLRSSQPQPSFFGWRNLVDEKLLHAVVDAWSNDRQQRQMSDTMNTSRVTTGIQSATSFRDKPLLILDARSYMAAWGNRAKGGGFESPEYYQCSEIDFVGLPNIHKLRTSFLALRVLCAAVLPEPKGWLPGLENTAWMHYLSSLLDAAVRVMRGLHDQGRPVLVHCSDGWDRTTQIVSLTKLLLDPYYRTLNVHKRSQSTNHTTSMAGFQYKFDVFRTPS